ncbi:hypothetical protein GALMADRAFT_213014 [Galerina marginata CBS 339.88]|uniref:F-box domain-containing protein n=1 Tax=Galerina marginata (strain CBS 339.88) TaxID=685588 RepID=A0A067SQA8_GALM3|nr:hypothetical protein GALMADRAFT_213014 [Galerina marginata CBS 339.88]
MTHINDLPFELLSRIFRKCLNVAGNKLPHLLPSNRNQPFTFLLVCKYWKHTALECRCLWTSVRIPNFTANLTEDDADTRRDFIVKWLSRAEHLPLQVRHTEPAIRFIDPQFQGKRFWRRPPPVFLEVGSYDRAQYYAAQMLEALSYHESRWRSLEIVFDSYLLQAFNHICKTYKSSRRTPCLGFQLRTLKFTLYDQFYSTVDFLTTSQWIAQLPALEKLDFEDKSNFIADFKVVPFSHFKAVKFARQTFPNHLTSEDAVQLISLSSSATDIVLVGCQLLQIDYPSNDSGLEKRNILPRLQRLTLTYVDSPVKVLDSFTLCALESLELTSGFSGCGNEAINIFQEFLSRCRCPLKRLIIQDKNMTLQQAFRILGFPELANVAEIVLVFADISLLSLSDEAQEPLYPLIYLISNGAPSANLNFLVWTQKVCNAQGSLVTEYRMGRKYLQDNETFHFAFRNGKVHCNLELSG